MPSTLFLLQATTLVLQGLLLPGNALPATQQYHDPGDLVINEIHYAPADSRLEFVEVFNRSTALLNLCTLSIADSRDEPVVLCDGDALLPPEQFAVIARDTMLLKQTFALPAALVQENLLLEPSSWPALNNSGDTVTLYAGAAMIDAVSYLPDWGGQRVSLERIDPLGPAAAFNWGSSVAQQGASPGYQNSIFNPDRTPPFLLLAERTTPKTLTLFWNEQIDFTALHLTQFQAGDQSPWTITPIDVSTFSLTFGNAVPANALRYDGISDLTGNTGPRQQHPIARLPVAGELLINEVMFAPRADPYDNLPDQPEYVEVFNASEHLLSLRHLALAGEADDRGEADTRRATPPLPVMVAGSFAILYAPGKTRQDLEVFEDAFPGLQTTSPLLLPVDAASLGLRNEGDRVGLVVGDSLVVDDLVYDPAWHHPLLEETRGRALERRRQDAATALPSNWSSAVTGSGGTPGRENSLRQITEETETNGQLIINPALFSPDGDGVNDVLTIAIQTEKASQAGGIKVFDLAGRQVRTLVETTLFQQREIRFWDGASDGGSLLPVGVYIVVVNLLDVSAGTTQQIKQPVILARQLR